MFFTAICGAGDRTAAGQASATVRLPGANNIGGGALTARAFPADEEKKCMLLIMRVLSIVPLQFKVRRVGRRRLAAAH